ncbi:MAG: hypothetical protein OFPII_43360 [Osedax symbiont Rs1]|nr:MAG: hypothetical protein OFPII_43360 [Osedax symbiont Rs1]
MTDQHDLKNKYNASAKGEAEKKQDRPPPKHPSPKLVPRGKMAGMRQDVDRNVETDTRMQKQREKFAKQRQEKAQSKHLNKNFNNRSLGR